MVYNRDILPLNIRLTLIILPMLFAGHLPVKAATDTLSVGPHYRQDCPMGEAYFRGNNFGLRTNLLLDAACVPNLGLEIAAGRNWSATVSGMYAWWSNPDRGRYWRLQGCELTVRKYFGHHTLSGHHLGVYAQILRYDLCTGNKGSLSAGSHTRFFNHPTLGIGAEYGYSFRLNRRLRLDLSIGAGYLSGRYVTYRVKDSISYLTSTKMRHYFGPTRAELSLVWIIGKGGGL